MFNLETASDPQISPDGTRVVFVRNFNDIMKDRKRSNLWIINYDGSDLRPLTDGNDNDTSPRWSPDGKRLLYVSTSDGSAQVYVRWMDSGQTAKLTRSSKPPSGMEWSPDGRWIAFSMSVADDVKPFVEMPKKPEGAEWAKPPKTIRRMVYRTDEQGYLEEAHRRLFIVPADGGTPHQLTPGGPGVPCENAEHYLKRSPLSLVGNVKTPTMLITGEADYRTPISEAEQFYEALKIRKIDTALVRIPDASHGMEGRPSYLVSKVIHILKWFEIHRNNATN